MGLGEKYLLTLAPARLVKVASAGSGLVTPFVVLTAPAGIVFVKFPLAFMVALRVNVQLELAARLPPLNEKELSPGFPLSAPPQVPTTKSVGPARYIPDGMVSVKLIPVNDTVLGLISWMLIVEEEPPKTVRGLKPLTIPIKRS